MRSNISNLSTTGQTPSHSNTGTGTDILHPHYKLLSYWKILINGGKTAYRNSFSTLKPSPSHPIVQIIWVEAHNPTHSLVGDPWVLKLYCFDEVEAGWGWCNDGALRYSIPFLCHCNYIYILTASFDGILIESLPGIRRNL